MVHELSSVQGRLRHFRQAILGLSLRDLQATVNAALPEGERVSLGTVANYERAPEGNGRRAGPRAEFVAGLKRAFPELRLGWLLLGEGEPTEAGGRVAELAGLPDRGSEGSLAGRLADAYPDLDLLSPEATALFVGALTRYATGEPEMALGESELLELAGDLRWLLFLPLALWGFEHRPDYRRFSDYCVAALQALTLAMPSTGGGNLAAAYPEAPNRRLRAFLEVGFGGGAGT